MANSSSQARKDIRQQHPFLRHLFERTSSTSPLRMRELRHYLGSTIDVPYMTPIDSDRAAAFFEQHSHIHTHVPGMRCRVSHRCESCWCTSMGGEVVEMFVPARWLDPLEDDNPIPDEHRSDMDYKLALTPQYVADYAAHVHDTMERVWEMLRREREEGPEETEETLEAQRTSEVQEAREAREVSESTSAPRADSAVPGLPGYKYFD